MQTIIWATVRMVGFHQWPDAPDDYKYLSFPHRHNFHVKVSLPVTDPDRQIEFHKLVQEVQEMLMVDYRDEAGRSDDLQFGNRSCEVIAFELARDLREAYYPDAMWIGVEVSEDGENGAIVTMGPGDDRDV